MNLKVKIFFLISMGLCACQNNFVKKMDTKPITHYSEIVENDGEKVSVKGIFYAREIKRAFSTNHLLLEDKTKVILSGKQNILTEQLNGKNLVIEGIIYLKSIPEEYGIIGRSSDPYLLDITNVSVED